MPTASWQPRRAVLLAAAVIALLAIAVPVIAADPSPAAQPEQRSGPPERPGKPEKAAKPDKGPELPVTITGVIGQGTDERGRPTYGMNVDGVAWELSAGPKWYWGLDNPLAAWVGQTVEVSGTHHEGEADLDVEAINGTALRAEGKPPWAGGPKAVGDAHPGWKAWKAAGAGRGHGREAAPGQLKDKSQPSDEDASGG